MLGKVTLSSIFLVCHLAVAFSSVFGQMPPNGIVYPDCSTVVQMDFDAKDILSKENRFLFEGDIEKKEALYCFAKRTGHQELEALSLFLIAFWHLRSNASPNSFQLGLAYMDSSMEISKKNGYVNTWLSAKEVLCSGLNSYEMYDQAHVCCTEFLDFAKTFGDSVRIAEGNMLLGRILKDRGEFTKSDSVLRRSLDFLQEGPAALRIGAFAYLHLSFLNQVKKDYRTALAYAQEGLALIEENETDHKTAIQALLAREVVICQLELGNYENEKMFDMVKKMAKGQYWVTGYYHDARAFYFEKTGQVDSAVVAYTKALDFYREKKINVNLLKTADNLLRLLWTKEELSQRAYEAHRSVQNALSELEGERQYNTSFERTYYQLKDEQNKSESLQKKANSYYRIVLLTLGTIILLLCTGILIYKQYRLKKRYNGELNGLNSKLVRKNEKLVASKKEIEEKNEKVLSELKAQLVLISGYGDQLKKLERAFANNKGLDTDFKQRIHSMLDFEKNKDVVEDINIKFLEANKELVSKLSHAHPNLTNNDLRLCLYLKMNLSTKEIAQLQHKTAESIKVARSRLRKKMAIADSSVKLTTFINSI